MHPNDRLPMDSLRPGPWSSMRIGAWPAVTVAVAFYALWLIAWYFDTVASMVSIWYRSETFAHGFIVFPVSLWLVWRQRRELALVPARPFVGAVPVLMLAGAAALWLTGELGDVLGARHLAWVTMLVAGIWLLVGPDAMRRLAFPLGFLYFAVPVGEFLLPTLMDWTADFTVGALRLSGVPVWRDGTTFQIPSGSWAVVEACSGLRYLIASLTVGTLYAYLTYRTLSRRLMFVGASIIVPILANWFRAYMIVMIGHLSGNRLAVGIDHIIYGWIFFGLVMLLLFWLGARWTESPAADPFAADARAPRANRAGDTAIPSGLGRALAFALVLSAAAPIALATMPHRDMPAKPDLTPPALAGWEPVAERINWVPDFTAPRAAIASTYARGEARAGLYVALYYDQDRESKLVSSRNQLMRTTRVDGHVITQYARTVNLDGGTLTVDESVLRAGRGRLLARNWFWVDGEFTASPVRAKILQMFARLKGHGDAGAIVVVWTPLPDEESTAVPPEANATLDDMTRKAVAELPAVLAQRLQVGSRSP